jgi:hypothetical protein
MIFDICLKLLHLNMLSLMRMLNLYSVAGSLKLVVEHNQEGQQIELTVMSHNHQPSSQTKRGSP